MSYEYPEDVAGPYEAPPQGYEDGKQREIRIERYDGDFDALAEMYLRFDARDRAQGIPPTGEERVTAWLDTLLTDVSVNVIAWHDNDAVGHATLVPDREGSYELAIFVLDEYQEAGIGTQLIEALLGAGREAGIDRVWLTVERWNEAAVALYRKVGFEPSDTSSFELEMAARLHERESRNR